MIMKNLTWLPVAFALCLGCAGAFAKDTPASANSGQAPEATTYQIRNLKYQELLRPLDANNADGTPIVLYSAQPWKCMTWRLQPAGESAFQVQNLFTFKTFGVSSTTNLPPSVSQVPLAPRGGVSPTWRFLRLEDGNYKITDSHSGRALTAVKAAGEYSIKIVAAPWQNRDEQKWRLEKMNPQQLTM
jgi:hypothetical protein